MILTRSFIALVLVLATSGRLVEGCSGRTDALEAAGRVPALPVPANRRVLALVDVEALPPGAVGRVALVADAPEEETPKYSLCLNVAIVAPTRPLFVHVMAGKEVSL